MELIKKSFSEPDQRPELPRSRAELLDMGDTILVRGHLEPGWRWSNDWRPVMQTPSCQMPHLGVIVAGRFHVELDDGTALEYSPGDAYSIPPGHDAWVVGDEEVQTLDFVGKGNAVVAAAIEAATHA